MALWSPVVALATESIRDEETDGLDAILASAVVNRRGPGMPT